MPSPRLVRIMNSKRKFTVFTLIRIGNAVLLVWALARHPIGYYTILRLVTCTVCGYGLYLAFQWKQIGWGFAFAALALLFQPVITLRMTKQTWGYVDVATAIFLIGTIFLFRGGSVSEARS